MATNVASLIGTLDLVDNFTGPLKGAQKEASGFAGKISSMGGSVAKFGAGLALMVAPVAAAFGGALNSAVQFDQSMTNAQAILGATKAEMESINAEVLAMGQNSMAGPQAVALAYGEVVGGVADAASHMAILDTAIRTAEAGQADLGATTSALVATMNAYKFGAEDAGRVSDIMTATVGAGVISMNELASAMPQVTSLASSMDIPFEFLGGAIAYMTAQGFSGAQSATALRASMVALLNPNDKMKNALEELGYANGQAAVDALGLQGALIAIGDTSAVAENGLAGTLGSVEALNAATMLMSDDATQFLDDFESMVDGATDAAREIQLDSPAAQMALLTSEVEALKIEIGTALLPVVRSILPHIRGMAQAAISYARDNPQVVMAVAAVTAGLIGLAAAATVIGGVLTAAGAALGFILSPLGLIVVGLAAFGLAYKTNFLGFRDLVDSIIGPLSAIVPLIRNMATTLANAFQTGGVSGFADKLIGRLRTGLESGFASLAGMVGSYGPQLLAGMAAGLASIGGWVIANIVMPIWNTISDPANWVAAGSFITSLLGMMVSTAGEAATWVRTHLVGPIWGAVTDSANWAEAGSFIASLLGMMVNAASGIAGWVQLHLIDPLWSALTNPANWIEGADFIGTVLSFMVNQATAFNEWVMANLISPIWNAITDGENWEAAGEFLSSLLGMMVNAATDFSAWVHEHITQPIWDAVSDKENWAAAGSFLQDLLALMIDTSNAVNRWVDTNIIQPMIGAITGAVEALRGAIQNTIDQALGMVSGSIDIMGLGQVNLLGAVGSVLGSHASGGWTGNAPSSQVTGLVHGQEWVVPTRGGLVLRESGGGNSGGGMQIHGDIHVYGVQDPEKFYDELLKVRSNRAAPAW